MKKFKTSLCVVVAAASLCAAAAASRPFPVSPDAAAHADLQGTATAYTLLQRHTYAPPDGQPYLRAEKRRYQRSDGIFAIEHTYYRRDGSVESEETGFGVLGVGVFRADMRNERLEFLAPLSEDALLATEAQLRSDPGFVREESVAGQRALVARYAKGADAPDSREVWRVPALQNFELKVLTVSARGEETVEPVELRMGEPDAALFRRLARFAKSFARFEGHIREAERSGNAELAARLRAYLERARR